MFTSGYELTTALTNVLIFIVSLFGFFKIKEHKLWKFFFLCMSIDSFIGSIVHGIVLSSNIINILWVILAFCFTITVNTLLCIFMKNGFVHITILSILLSILLFVQMIYEMDFLLTFTFYVLIILFISLYYIIKEFNKYDLWIILGFVFQVIGGILMLCKCKFYSLNHNGIYHMFAVFTLICFYIGIKKKYNLCYTND